MSQVFKTKGHKKALLKTANPKCGICGGEFLQPEDITIDHIIPKSKGGSNYRDNVQLAHAKCNRRKADRINYKLLPKPLRQKAELNSLEIQQSFEPLSKTHQVFIRWKEEQS